MVMGLAVVGGSYFGWQWIFDPSTDDARQTPPTLTTDRPESGPLDGGPHADVPERGEDPLSSTAGVASSGAARRGAAILVEARRALSDRDLVLARAHYSEALSGGLSAKDELEARTELRNLGQETLFSSRVAKGDPLSDFYAIAPGDTLQKIARRHDITAGLLARVNGIQDANRIQAGRRIKVIHGPFHVRVNKRSHTLDVYCGGTFVEHFKVGLGAEDGTPTGKWMVRNKLKNPTYYPPRGGDIVSADDPENPLGERWIGLEGVDGDAVGQARYGIHGTIEPDSIGKDASMGCIRLHNEDVEFLFDLLIEKKSFVEIVE
jgi:lipoprotein-anchoring transpeptidase ErfK/SrfK